MIDSKIFFSVESCINILNLKINGSFFHKYCTDINFNNIFKDEYRSKYNISCNLKIDESLEYKDIENVAISIRDRIFSILVILSQSDCIVSDEISIKTSSKEYTIIKRTDIAQIKKMCGLFDVKLSNSKLNLLKDNEWNFLNRYSKTFLSVSKQERIRNILSVLDIGGVIEIENNRVDIENKVTNRMKYFMAKIGIPDEFRENICKCRHSIDHENNQVELPKEFNIENIRRLIYPFVEKMIGIKSFNLGINLGDEFSILE